MLNFRKITIDDMEPANAILQKTDTGITEHCFTDLFIWKDHYKTEICIHEGFFFVRSRGEKGFYYIAPVGSGDFEKALGEIAADAAANGADFMIGGMTKKIRDDIERCMPGRFSFTEIRDSFDYVYTSEALIGLRGKKLHSKRNFINRFTAEYAGRWEYADIKPSDLEEIYAFHRRWCESNGCKMDEQLRDEICAVRLGLKNYDRLGIRGGVLRLDGNVIAFSFGTRSSSGFFIVHVEKAAGDVPGAYPMINREFAARNCQDVPYINREEDLGLEGLRKSKLSYHPEFLIEKYIARPVK